MGTRTRWNPGPRFLLLAMLGIGGGAAFLASCTDATPTSQGGILLPLSLSIAPAASGDELQAIREAFDRVNAFRVVVRRLPSLQVAQDTLLPVTPGLASYDLRVSVALEGKKESFELWVIGLDGETPLFSATATVQLLADELGGGARQSFVLPLRYVGPGVRAFVLDPGGHPVAGAVVEILSGEALLGRSVGRSATDADGMALFANLPGGSYLVRPLAGGEGSSYCPASRHVVVPGSGASAEARFEQTPFPCEIRVLVLSGGDKNHNAYVSGSLQPLMPDTRFGSFFFVNDPPSLQALALYNVVLLYEDGGFGGSEMLGNRLADYLAAGGGLVIGSFYWQNRSDGPFRARGWGRLEGFDVFSSAGGATYTPGRMDPGSKVRHVVMAGVNSIESEGLRGGVAGGGGGVLALWDDGTPLVGISGEGPGARVAAISFFPAGGATGDAMLLYANALRWAGTR